MGSSNSGIKRSKSVKLLEENIRGKLLDTSLGNDFFGYNTKIIGNESKNRLVGLHQTEKNASPQQRGKKSIE